VVLRVGQREVSVEAAPAGSLENNANNSATAGQRDVDHADYRTERWAARGVLWTESRLKRCRCCGRVTITPDGSVQVRANGQAVGFAGLASCGSVWVCPVCNAKVQAVRRFEVGLVLAWALQDGGGAFGAYTLCHHRGERLRDLWDGLNKCWAAVGRDGSVKRLRARLGWVGYVRTVEVTCGVNGWHPHLHPLHLFSRPVSAAEVAQLHRAEFRAWEAAAGRLGLRAPVSAAQELHAVDGAAAHVEVAEYFTKASYMSTAEAVGWEMTSTQSKTRTRAKDSRTPWDLLRAVYLDGDAEALDLWHEWESDSKGKRAISWSRGLRKSAGLLVEATDEEIAEREIGSRADVGMVVTDWGPIQRDPRLGAGLLAAVGPDGNWDDGRRYADDHGIEWRDA